MNPQMDPRHPPVQNPPQTGPLVPPSTLPPIGATGQQQPAGQVGGLQVLNWAGFRAEMSYRFDDTNQTQIDRYAALMAWVLR
jgi:hypothetical protein